ncbi:MAG TPA: glutamate--tRNA ligase [Planctomycetota bacterium]|nr:glutamate--tRNA ligase [Planctomycetota bacterium]
MSSSSVRVRFAPSPTGYLHVGGVRTALFNWLYARKTGGKFILRIEDTDIQRNKEEATQIIIDGLKWCGLNWDEGPDIGGPFGPYFQSQRMERYRAVGEALVKAELAYWAKKEGGGPLPDWKIEKLKKQGKWDEEKAQAAADPNPALYLKVDLKGRSEITFDDAVKGPISKPAQTYLEEDGVTPRDFVILRSNGMPVYNFACVIDDVDMHISHVIRGDDHVENTFRQIFIYEALEKAALTLPSPGGRGETTAQRIPVFAHLPMIFNEEGKKISKRRDPVAITLYQNCGLLPEAMINFEALLGWSPGDGREIMPLEDIVREFAFDRIKSAAAQFTLNRKTPPPVPAGGATTDAGIEAQIVEWLSECLKGSKLEWINGEYMRKLTPDELISRARPFLNKQGYKLDHYSPAWLRSVLAIEQERSKTLKQLAENVALFFKAPAQLDAKAVDKVLKKNDGLALLKEMRGILAGLEEWSGPVLDSAVKHFAESKGRKLGEVAQPLRVALSGTTVSPPIHETLLLLGQAESLKRIDHVFSMVTL